LVTPCPTSAAAEWISATSSPFASATSRAIVVEALRVADVLEAEGEAGSAPDAVAARRVAGAPGKADGVARELLRLRLLDCRAAADHLRNRKRAGDALAGGQRVPVGKGIAEAQVDWIDSQRRSQLVHLPLGREAGLNGTEAAHGAAGRVVREDGLALDQSVGNRVGAAGERGGVRADGGRAGGVRAPVEQDLHADTDELAVAVRAVLGPDLGRVAMHVAREGLLAVVDHLHGAVRLQREQGAVDLHGKVLAAAEGAPDAGEVDAHLFGLESEAGRYLVAVDVQPLGGDVDVDATLPVGDGEAGLGAEEGLILDAELVDALHGDGSLRLGISVADSQLAERLLRALGVDDRLLGDVVDLDLGRGAARLLWVLGRDDCHRLSEVADVLHGEDGLVGELEAVALLSRDVLVCEHSVDAGHAARLARVDALDARGRVRAADGMAEEHAGGEEVAGIGELAGDLGDRVDAAH
jgi:hypothetical protein